MKRAFSLIELLIVVLIIGVVYTLALNNLQMMKEGKVKPTLLTLKSYLSKIKYDKQIKLLCLDNCESCVVFVDGKFDEKLSEEFEEFIDSSVVMYSFNINTGFSELPKEVFFNKEQVSEDICFSFSVDKKGMSDQVVVEYKEKVYDFMNYLTGTKVYVSTAELMDEKQRQVNEVLE